MRRLAEQDGFTIMEVLIGMVLTVVVFGATLTVLDAFSHQWQVGQQRLSSLNYARTGIDRIVRQLRNIASPAATPKLLERANSNDIVFQTVGTPSGSNTTGAERVRYCIPDDPSPGSSSKEVLIGETQTWSTSTVPADPWSSDSSTTIACPDSPLPAGVTKNVVANAVTNRYRGQSSPSRAPFLFNDSASAPTDLSTIFTVQIRLFVNDTPSQSRSEAELESSAFLRNQPRAPVSQFTYTATGGGGVLLNGGISYSPDGENLAYSWACTSPSPCPDASGLNAGTGLIDWQPGAGTYTVTLTVTDQTGLSTTSSPQTVTVT